MIFFNVFSDLDFFYNFNSTFKENICNGSCEDTLAVLFFKVRVTVTNGH